MSAHSYVLTPEQCEVACLHPEHVTPLLGRVLDYSAADRVAATFAVLADPTRARIVHALSIAGAELCVCDIAVLLGIVGMFVIPVVGFVVGFVGGIFLVEQGRSRDRAQAWARTKNAVVAVVTSMGIELCAGVLIAATWVVGVLAT